MDLDPGSEASWVAPRTGLLDLPSEEGEAEGLPWRPGTKGVASQAAAGKPSRERFPPVLQGWCFFSLEVGRTSSG